MTSREVAFGAALGALVATGCVDTTPLPYDAPVADGGQDGPALEASTLNACRACVTGEGAPCRAGYEGCAADPRCVEFTDCLFEVGCFSREQLQDRIACGSPCFEKAGIAASSDPALTHALAINACTSPGNACADACLSH